MHDWYSPDTAVIWHTWRLWAVACTPWVSNNPEDRKCRRDLCECRQRCILVHRHVGARSRCALQVRLQDRGTLVDGHLVEVDRLTTATVQHGSATGSPHVADPLPIIAEHRHQVPLSIDDGNHHR